MSQITKKHIAFVCSGLNQPGGIERAITNTANLLAEEGHPVTLLILDTSTESFFPLDSRINVLGKNLNFGITHLGNAITRKLSFFSHVRQLRQLLKNINASVVIATEYHYAIACKLAAGKRQKVISWEHHHFYHLEKSLFWKALFHLQYKRLSCVVCLNTAEEAYYKKLGCHTAVIPNHIIQNKPALLQQKSLLTIGWLSHTKGVDLIPAIADVLFKNHPDWKWIIVGNVHPSTNLLAELTSRNLLKYFEFHQTTSHNVMHYYQSAAMYVMTSRFECLPLVLLESMANGVPQVAFNCPTGPRFLIENEKSGVLITPFQTNQMAAAISRLIARPELRKQMGAAAYQLAANFSPPAIYARWQQLFKKLFV